MNWHYDVLQGLEYLSHAGVARDDHVSDGIELVRSKRDADGRWPLEVRYPSMMLIAIDAGEGQPSRWNTLLRLLGWIDESAT